MQKIYETPAFCVYEVEDVLLNSGENDLEPDMNEANSGLIYLPRESWFSFFFN